jgi:hypothetical protein
MYDTKKAFKKAHRPFTIVRLNDGSVGLINEVSINHCQDKIDHQIGYSVLWFHNATDNRNAWWKHKELNTCKVGNLFDMIAEASCHPFGGNSKTAVELMRRGDK